MSTPGVRLPDSSHREVRELAKEGLVSINQFISLALAEKVSFFLTVEFLKQRASCGSAAHMLSVLESASDIEPEPNDKL